jgi:hypothetical protein
MNTPTGTPSKIIHNNSNISYTSPSPNYKRLSPNISFSSPSSPSSAHNITHFNKKLPVQSLYSSSSSKQNTSKIFGNEMLNNPHMLISMNKGKFKLEPEFKEYLLERIPIFKDEYLYSLIIKYCLALNSNINKNIEKSKNDIKEYLLEIKKE